MSERVFPGYLPREHPSTLSALSLFHLDEMAQGKLLTYFTYYDINCLIFPDWHDAGWEVLHVAFLDRRKPRQEEK